MTSLYDRIARTTKGARALASARLRHEVLGLLYEALEKSGLTSQSDLARILGIRRSAVNQVFRGDGNVRISTLAEYLHALGFELDLQLIEAGEPRRAAVEGRSVRLAPSSANTIAYAITGTISSRFGEFALAAISAISTESIATHLETYAGIGGALESQRNLLVDIAIKATNQWPELPGTAEASEVYGTSTSMTAAIAKGAS